MASMINAHNIFQTNTVHNSCLVTCCLISLLKRKVLPFKVSSVAEGTKDFIQQSTVPVNHVLGQFSHSTAPMNHALGQFSQSTVPINHEIGQFSHNCANESRVRPVQSLNCANKSRVRPVQSLNCAN